MGILALLPGIIKFVDEIRWLIGTLQKTPIEEQEALMKKIKQEAENFAKTNRPTWN